MGELKIIDSKVIDALKSEDTKQFINKIMNDRSNSFVTSMISVVSATPELQKCTPASILGACLKAAALNLPIEPSLGFAYPMPYGGTATFVIGWKGYIQLAMRTGQYKKIVVTDVRVGEVVKIDHFTETYLFSQIQDDTKRQKSPICGYYAMFELKNGFVKEIYWTLDKLLAHAKQYSPSFNFRNSAWKTAQDAMCRKTMIKQLIKYGIMSAEMQQAYEGDGATIKYDTETGEENIIFDNPPDNAIDAEIIEPEVDPAEAEFQGVISKDE